MTARILITASAAVILAFGLIHLVYTFRGTKLTPRDTALRQQMQEVSPVITSETNIWKTWIGVNATHSLALILFGLIYGYLALEKSEVLFNSPFLLFVGFAMLLALAVICRLYFFSIPFRGISVALLCYIVGVVLSKWKM
jgi:hypothetical protein